jgi:hypothetical protein
MLKTLDQLLETLDPKVVAEAKAFAETKRPEIESRINGSVIMEALKPLMIDSLVRDEIMFYIAIDHEKQKALAKIDPKTLASANAAYEESKKPKTEDKGVRCRCPDPHHNTGH